MDERLALAFREAEKALAHQDTSLSNLRERAASLLSTAAVLTTLAPALGLIAADPDEGNVLPRWLAISVVLVVVGIGTCAVAVLIPRSGWTFTNNPRTMVDEWIDTKEATLDAMHRALVHFMRGHEERNRAKLDRLYLWYRVGVALLIVQTGMLVAGFTIFTTA